MIGPAARRHFYKALQHAGEAERNLVPGNLVDRVQQPLMRAQIELVKGIAFAFLAEGVSFRVEENDERTD